MPVMPIMLRCLASSLLATLVLAGCSDDSPSGRVASEGDSTSEAGPMATIGEGVDAGVDEDTTTTGEDDQGTSSSSSLSSTSTGRATQSTGTQTCPVGTRGCPCGQEGICEGELRCRESLCLRYDDMVGGSSSSSSSGIVELEPGCANGVAERDELCLQTPKYYGVGSSPVDIALGDLDDDGHLDIVTALSTDGAIRVQLGDGQGAIASSQSFAVGGGPAALALGLVNDDDDLDVVVVNETDNTVAVLLGRGDGTFDDEVSTFNVGAGPRALTLANLDDDDDLDALTVNGTDGTLTVLRGGGFGFTVDPSPLDTGLGPAQVVLAEVSGDRNLDIVVANAGATSFGVLLGLGDATWATHSPHEVEGSPVALVVDDFNEDGPLDVVTVGSADMITLRNGAGDATFGGQIPFATGGVGASDLVAADFDGSGTLDLAIASRTSNEVTILEGTGTGVFASPQSFPVAPQPVALAVGDVNGDDALDIVVAHQGDGTVGILLSEP